MHIDGQSIRALDGEVSFGGIEEPVALFLDKALSEASDTIFNLVIAGDVGNNDLRLREQTQGVSGRWKVVFDIVRAYEDDAPQIANGLS